MPELDDEQYWRGEVVKRRRGQLETVRKAATNWSALFGAVLGVFGTVAFAGGLTGLDELAEQYQLPVKLGTVLAALLAMAATILAAAAAGPSPRPSDNSTWQNMRDTTNSRAEHGLTLLKLAKFFGAVAAVIVTVGSIVIVIVGKDVDTPQPPDVVAIVDGVAVCGPLTKGADGDITVAARSLRDVSTIQIVASCP